MSDPLFYFLNKFREIWRESKDARLIVECHAGQAWLSLHHHLPCPPPPSWQSPPHRQSRPSPSRIRRRLRRANARAVAEQATHVSVQRNEDDVTGLACQIDKAVQTKVSETVDEAVQVNIQEAHQVPPPDPTIAVHIEDQPSLHYPAPQAEQASHGHSGNHQNPGGQQQYHQAAVQIQGARDNFHQEYSSDSMSSNQRIPQLDGNISSDLSVCNNCQKTLLTIDDYKWHFETKHGREDCRILRSMMLP